MLRKRNLKNAFTLIELLVVILILAILAAMIVPRVMGKTDDAKVSKAKSDIQALRTALHAFKLDTGRYPTTEEGLPALEQAPADVNNWKGPYTDRPISADPWGFEYVYETDGSDNISVVSYGQDGAPGGEGPAADVDIDSQ